MKKIFLISLTAILALASCVKLGIDEKPIAEVKLSADPVITNVIVDDTTLSFSIEPANGTGFYSYTVLAGTEKTVNANTLFKVGMKGLVNATANYKDEQKVSIVLEGLERNQAYTIYAVAASEQGILGNVVAFPVKTSDGQNPSFKSYGVGTNAAKLTFSENVKLAEGAEVKVKYYGIYAPEFEMGEVPATVSVNGAEATFSFNVPAGAYYSISVPAGAFVDESGNPCGGLASACTIADGTVSTKNIASRNANQAFDISFFESEPIVKITSLTSPIWFSIPEGVVVAKTDSKATGTVTYEGADEKHVYTTNFGYDFGWNSTYSCALAYPNLAFMTNRPDPLPGNMVTMEIPAGFLIDIYGNKNNGITVGPVVYVFGYSVEDFTGTYRFSGLSAYGPTYDENPFDMVFEASDDASKGNVMLTSYYGFDNLKIYADFDVDLGTITMNTVFQPLGVAVGGGYVYDCYLVGYNSALQGKGNDLVINMPKAGYIQLSNDYLGVYYEVYEAPADGKIPENLEDLKSAGYDYNVFADIELTKLSSASEAALKVAPTSFKTGKVDFSTKTLIKK